MIAQYEKLSQNVKITLPDGGVVYGMPSSYLTKFNRWHSPHIAMCLDSIGDVLSDRLYDDWYSQLRACLDYFHVVFELTIEDAKNTLEELNGELDREIGKMLNDHLKEIYTHTP